MESKRNTVFIGNMLVTLLLVGGVAGNANANPRSCGFPAIFNFGDSNSDTGASSTVFNELILPWGITAGKNNKRISDGRLLIDFFAEHLGLPYLNATLDSIGTSFRHGANFAVGGVKISPEPSGKGVSNFCLDVQVSQFLQFKSRSIALHKQLPINYNGARPPFKSMFPEPEVFSKALYTFDIGHNDFNSNFDGRGIAGIVDVFSNSVQRLLDDGAKFLWIHNTVPHGCLPQELRKCASFHNCLPQDFWKCEGCPLDEIGCLKSKNEQSQDFNEQLKVRVDRLRTKYPEASITYVDTYSAKLLLISNAKKYGFESPFDFCCGNDNVPCGKRVDAEGVTVQHECGKLISPVCNDPSKYISWDGVHFSEAAVKFYAPLIINGTYSDPPLPLAEACHKS